MPWKKISIKSLKCTIEPRWFFLVIIFFLGTATTFIVPPLWGFDETSHFSRVYLLSKGQFLPSQKAEMPVSFNKVVWYAVADIGEDKQPDIFLRKDLNDNSAYKKILNNKFSTQKEAAINPASYSFFAYPLSVIAVALTNLFNISIGATIIIARLAGLITFILLVYTSIYLLDKNKFKKTQWMIICVSLLPTTLFQAATLSADTVVNGLAILFVALLIIVMKQQSTKNIVNRKYIIGLLTVAVLLPLVKVNYLFLSMGIIFLKGSLLGGRRLSVILKTTVIIGSLLLSLFLTFGLAGGATSTHSVSPRPDGQSVSQASQAAFVVHHPLGFMIAGIKSLVIYGDLYIQQMTTVLSWNYVSLPNVFTITCIVLILAASFYARSELMFMKKVFNIMLLFSVLGIGSIFLALYLAFTPVGKMLIDGVQGRYMIPFIIPIAGAIVMNINVRLIAKERSMNSIMSIGIGLILVGSILYYIKATY